MPRSLQTRPREPKWNSTSSPPRSGTSWPARESRGPRGMRGSRSGGSSWKGKGSKVCP
ncbi:unnamed protein product [Linum tenue]|uniref:Uncharacterized protein n=1 Tax=Linum tenue TaxID=586396 RepID=A0AAV0NHX5_9ROSI|nr:unnamed protein product [Linum tenue]